MYRKAGVFYSGGGNMFADRARIYIKSGKGGNGHISFRREKFVPAGGPDGGNGGKGGDVIFVVDKGMNTLSDFRVNSKYVAESGQEGGAKRCTGKSGKDLIIKVPEGTVIYDDAGERVIADMSAGQDRLVLLHGGRGGKGNMNYATPTMQAPQYAQPGQEARGLWVRLELKCIADVGLVGYPNAGKSTLLARVTNADPKIANYPFTTLQPNLGVVDLPQGAGGFVIADIPGLIEGASEGVGLGHEFLRHIERCRVLIHMVDVAGSDGRDPAEDIRTINSELTKYDTKLLKKPQVIACNKIDAVTVADGEEDPVAKIRREFESDTVKVFAISAVSGQGVKELLFYVKHLLDTAAPKPVRFESQVEPDMLFDDPKESYTVTVSDEDPHTFLVFGPRIDRMLGYTNLEAEKGFQFFQKYLKETGILDELKALGIQDGDTVRVGSDGDENALAFDYYE